MPLGFREEFMKSIHRILCGALLIALPAAAAAQADSRPMRLVAAFPPGAPTDLVARVVGQGLSDALKRTVVVENRPGAGGIIAAQTTKRANPDGNTVLVTSTSVAINVNLRLDPGYAMSD